MIEPTAGAMPHSDEPVETVDGILSASRIVVLCSCGHVSDVDMTNDSDLPICGGCGRQVWLDAAALDHLVNPHDGTPGQAREQENRTANLYSSNVLAASSRVRRAIEVLGGVESPTANAILRSLGMLRVLREADTLLQAAISFMVRGQFDESSVPIPKGDCR